MKEQARDGHEVFALWPGRFFLRTQKTKIREHHLYGRQFADCPSNLRSFEIIGALPFPYDEGIRDISAFMQPGTARAYGAFLDRVQPDVLHVHTLMGMHEVFLTETRRRGIRIVYTAHDFFGICPKITLYRDGHVCTEDHDCRDCASCCRTALPRWKLALLQGPLYRHLKETAIVRGLRYRHRAKFFRMKTEDRGEERQGDYAALRRHYLGMLEQVDCIHFASDLTRNVYSRYIDLSRVQTMVSHISLPDICDHRSTGDTGDTERLSGTAIPSASSDKLCLLNIGGLRRDKGFPRLIRVLDELQKEGIERYEVRMYQRPTVSRTYLNYVKNGYDRSELAGIWAETDLLILPGNGYETFGLIVAEALSYGVPVLASDHVGAKDLIGEGGYVFPAEDTKALRNFLRGLDREQLTRMRKKLRQQPPIRPYRSYMEDIYVLYQGTRTADEQ